MNQTVNNKLRIPETLRKVKNIVGIFSAKGGVGKSAVALQLAISLKNKGYKVGLVDADIYGPSQAVLLKSKPSKGNSYSVDRYNRVLAKIVLDGMDVNLLQVSRGYAWHFKKYRKQQSLIDREAYSDAEFNAKKNKLGLWKEKKPIAPWNWRKMKN